MNIGIITTYADKVIVSREELINSIIGKGHEITIIGSEFIENSKIEINDININYIRIPFQRTNTNPVSEIKFIINTSKILKTLDLDIIIIYGVRLSPSVAIASKLANINKIYSVVNGAGTLFYMKGFRGRLIRILSYPLLFIGFNLCNNIIFQNSDNLDLFIKLGLTNKNKSVVVNGSGVNLKKFLPQPLGNDYIFLFVGRLIRDKGVIEFVESAKEVKTIYPDSKFLIIGSYDENLTAIREDYLRDLIEMEIIEHIEWTDRVDLYLKKSYAFVLPSYHEGIPRTTLEAMATGRAILTTDAPGCRETVKDGLNGFLVPVEDSKTLAEKMIYMIENHDEVEQMGIESRRICEEKFDVRKVNEKIIQTMGL